MKLFLKFILIFVLSNLFAQETTQTFLSLKNTGVESFKVKYPEFDGRGTIIFVLDTGVDMGVDGLTKTSTDDVKVIDVQDFTGQGDIGILEAEIVEEEELYYFVNKENSLKIKGAKNLSKSAVDDKYFIGVVPETLWKNSGSGAEDINQNGTTDDNFYFVTFETSENGENFWVLYIDSNHDGDLSDEKALRNYKEKYDTFTFFTEKGLTSFTIAINIFPEKRMVNFFFDDGSHGTHCAGISAGNKIGNNNLYGIAPGAKVIGLKLGDNNLAGGATVSESMKLSYLYADKVSKEREEPCIINMSFGIGSEIEGQADIEVFLDELVKNNPYLYIATSNGNEGPGLSTSGIPASSNSIFSTGAVLAKEVGNDLYGTTLDRDIILHFSSRGGEVTKPDVVAPGACVSTVPNFSRGDRFWGTSMASPYSAGVMSVLLGAAKKEFPNVKIPSLLLYTALRESAQFMPGYDFVDQGNGLINVEAAWELLKKYINDGEISKFETYSVSSFAPNMPDSKASNFYVRDASFLTGLEKFSFRITRNNFINQKSFYRLFNLKSSADWLKPMQKTVHIRNNQPTVVNFMIDNSILTKPGLYNSKIKATRADKTAFPEFDLMATLIVPFEFNSANNYSLFFENEKVLPGDHKRYFIKIPAGSSHLSISLESGKKNYTALRYYLHNPSGKREFFGNINSINKDDKKVDFINNIEPGIYELIVLGEFTSEKESTYNLTLEIDAINFLGHYIGNNKPLEIVNYFSKQSKYDISGKLKGYQKEYTVNFTDQKIFSIPITLQPGESKKEFAVSLSKTDFNKLTDFALMIYDDKGKAQFVGGLSYRSDMASINKIKNDATENYKFVLIPGFANGPTDLEIKIVEYTYLEKEVDLNLKSSGKSNITMYPYINYNLDVNFSLPEIELTEGTKYFGEIYFKSGLTDKIDLTKKILINN